MGHEHCLAKEMWMATSQGTMGDTSPGEDCLHMWSQPPFIPGMSYKVIPMEEKAFSEVKI